jgi:NAD(P)-dependent dehydrogenase (short-subunit alcohol dehydrogenase family)
MRVLVTGASRGLGLAFCQKLAERGDDVLAVVRQPNPEIEATGATIIAGIDVADDASVARLAEAVGDEPIDLVIANAGINKTYAQGIAELDLPTLKEEFDVNTFGPIRTIQAVLPRLQPGARIAVISTWRPEVGAARRNYGYQMSKVALNQMQFLLADELAERGISTVVLSPGPMNTKLLREVVEAGHANLTADQAQNPLDVARDLLVHIDALDAETSGRWLFRTGDSMTDRARGPVFGH